MVEKKRKKGLGRGLSALLDDTPAQMAGKDHAITTSPIDQVHANPDQPRRAFPPAEIKELAQSLRDHGVLQPLLVRPNPESGVGYQIVAGERRWRAAQMAGLHEVPIVVRDFSDAEMLEAAIVENVQRADLNPIEEALGYRQLIDKFGHSQGRLAESVGKSRPHIANTLRLLALPDDVRDHLSDGRLSAGHGRALVTADDPSALAQKAIAEDLSVRQTEALAKAVATPRRAPPRAVKDADTRILENDLSVALGLKVAINHKPTGGGELKVAYASLDELDGLCRLLNAER